MSYDIRIGDMNRNMTSNCARMWDRAMPDINLRDMHNKTGAECLPHLKAGMLHMAQNRGLHIELEASCNGWGSAYGALTILVEMAHECELHPDDIVSVHC